jgi:hypothetical protein
LGEFTGSVTNSASKNRSNLRVGHSRWGDARIVGDRAAAGPLSEDGNGCGKVPDEVVEFVDGLAVE